MLAQKSRNKSGLEQYHKVASRSQTILFFVTLVLFVLYGVDNGLNGSKIGERASNNLLFFGLFVLVTLILLKLKTKFSVITLLIQFYFLFWFVHWEALVEKSGTGTGGVYIFGAILFLFCLPALASATLFDWSINGKKSRLMS